MRMGLFFDHFVHPTHRVNLPSLRPRSNLFFERKKWDVFLTNDETSWKNLSSWVGHVKGLQSQRGCHVVLNRILHQVFNKLVVSEFRILLVKFFFGTSPVKNMKTKPWKPFSTQKTGHVLSRFAPWYHHMFARSRYGPGEWGNGMRVQFS